MTDLVDPETGQAKVIPPGQAEQQYLQGQAGFSGDKANLVNPDSGDTYEIPADTVTPLIQAGWSFETPHNEVLRNFREDVREHPWTSAAKTFLGQAGNQALLGVPGVAADTIQGKESIAAGKREILKEEDPVSNFLGGASGIGLQVMYGGPLWKGLGYAGDTAANATLNIAKSFGADATKSFVAKTIAATAKGATEGALISAPQALTPAIANTVLGDPNKVGENLVAAMGTVATGALFGGAMFGAGSMVAQSPIATVFKTVSSKFTPDALNDVANRYQVKQLDIFKKGFSKIANLDPKATLEDNIEKIVNFADSQGFTKSENIMMNPLERSNALGETRQKLYDSLNNVRAEADKLRPGGFDISQIPKDFDSLMNQFRDDPGSLNDIRKLTTQFEASKGQVTYKKWVDAVKAENDGVIPRGLEPPVTQANNGAWLAGDDAVYSQRDLYDIKNKLHDIAYPANDPNRPYFRPFPSSPGAEAAYRHFEGTVENSLDGLVKSGMSDTLQAQYEGAKTQLSSIFKMMPIFNDAAKNFAARNTISLGDQIAAGIGGDLGGVKGAVVGGIMNFIKRKFGNQMAASTIYKAADMLDAFQKQALGPVADLFANNASRAALPLTTNALNEYFQGDENAPKTPADQIQEIGRQVAAFTTDANAAAQATDAVTQSFAKTAPQIQAGMTATIARAADYLSKNTPMPEAAGTPLDPVKFSPTDREISQFKRKLATVMDPTSALKDLANGIITMDQVDAMEKVYPALTAAVRTKIMTAMAGKDTAFSPKARAALKLFLGGSSVSDKSGAAIQLLQENFFQQNQAKPLANSKINAGSRLGTPVNALMSQ